jgi:hypothetical protein
VFTIFIFSFGKGVFIQEGGVVLALYGWGCLVISPNKGNGRRVLEMALGDGVEGSWKWGGMNSNGMGVPGLRNGQSLAQCGGTFL